MSSLANLPPICLAAFSPGEVSWYHGLRALPTAFTKVGLGLKVEGVTQQFHTDEGLLVELGKL